MTCLPQTNLKWADSHSLQIFQIINLRTNEIEISKSQSNVCQIYLLKYYSKFPAINSKKLVKPVQIDISLNVHVVDRNITTEALPNRLFFRFKHVGGGVSKVSLLDIYLLSFTKLHCQNLPACEILPI